MSGWQEPGFNQPAGGPPTNGNNGGFDNVYGNPTSGGLGSSGGGFDSLSGGFGADGTTYGGGGYNPSQEGFSATHNAQPGGALGESGQLAFTSAPHLLLLPSLISGIIAVVLSLVLFTDAFTVSNSKYLPIAAGAWAFAGIVGIGCFGPYFRADNAQRTSGIYQVIGWKQGLYWATVIAVLLGIVLSAIHLGLWVGKN